jgi:hypothetical protein
MVIQQPRLAHTSVTVPSTRTFCPSYLSISATSVETGVLWASVSGSP